MSKKETDSAVKKSAGAESVKAQVVNETASDSVPEGGFMYVGPTIPNFAIQNAMYTDIPEEAKQRFAENPVLRNLFIQIKDWPKANEMIRTQSGYIWTAWQAAMEIRR